MTYQIIPRKYRPQTFASVVGQDAVVTTLKNALRSQRLAHAYLFCGSRGTGKTTLARVFAKALNCHHLTSAQEPCNACPSCLEVAAGRSLDVLEIDGASNRGIDDIRQINETVGYAAASGKYKIYIIDEVHMLTKEAFNALLKTLEEPPSNVKFFFATTEPHKVLPTIISRCQRFDLNRISAEAMHRKLAQIGADLNVSIEENALRMIAQIADGSLRDAESLLDQAICFAEGAISAEMIAATLGLMPRTDFFALDEAIHQGRLLFAFELTAKIFAAGKDLAYFLEGLMEHFRILLLLKLKSTSTTFDFLEKEDQARYALSATLYTEAQCIENLDFLIHWSQQMTKTPFKRVTLEMILLRLVRSRHRVPLENLVQRLVDLEKSLQGGKVSPEPLPQPQTAPAIVAIIEPPPAPLKKEEPQLKEEPKKVEKAEIVEDHSLEEKLLQAIKAKAQPPVAPPAEKNEPAPSVVLKAHKSKYDTLVRFAAVELEGSVIT